MAERHNEITGGQFHGPVVQAGGVDSIHIHVGAGQGVSDRPWLKSWVDRPPLTPALVDLLTAQREATESLPYRLLGVRQPELTRVYVQQAMRSQSTDRLPDVDRKAGGDRKTGAETGEGLLTVTEVLDRDQHLLITGEPGAGKSTLGHMYVQRIADYWLTSAGEPPPLSEPVLPLRVPARAFATNAAWSVLLAGGAREALGRLLAEPPQPELFGRRALGARWLVFVDGLDEIADPDTRQQVIKAIAYQIRRGTDHRLVVTTRPLPDDELAPLTEAGAGTYGIQPFGPVELDEFATAWFRAQDPMTGATRAREFVRQVRDGRLRELVRNPLLVTIAAISYTLEPQRKLPNSRVDLYERFMRYLLADRISGRDTAAELRNAARDHPTRLRLVEWLDEHRTAIIEELAVGRLETEPPPLSVAEEWVRQRQTVVADPDELPEGWWEDLRALLFGSGVFVRAEDDLRFLHHSFAEFLAAQRRAAEIPDDFPDMNTWIKTGLTPTRQVYALFTFVLWGRRTGHGVAPVLRRLLGGDGEHVMLAGRLLAEAVTVPDELATAVVDRLVELILANGTDTDPWDDSQEIGRVLTSIGDHAVQGSVIDRLRDLRDRPELAVVTRIESASALGHLVDANEAVRWLEHFATEVDPPAVEHIAQVLIGLLPDGADRAERLLLRLATSAADDYVVVAAAIKILQEIDRADAAAPLIRDLTRRLRADPGVVAGQAAIPNRATNQPVPLRIYDAWGEGPATWVNLARWAVKSRCVDEARWAAGMIFAQAEPDVDEFGEAVGVLLSVLGAEALPDIRTSCRSRPLPYLVEAADQLWSALYVDAAVELARGVVSHPDVDNDQFVSVARFLIMQEHAMRAELLAMVADLPMEYRFQLVRVLDRPEARVLSRQALADPTTEPLDFWHAADIVLDPNEPETANDVYRAALDRSPAYWGQAAPLLLRGGYRNVGADLLGRLVAAPQVDLEVLFDAVTDLSRYGESAAASEVLDTVLRRTNRSTGQHTRLAAYLHDVGRSDEALALARLAVRIEIADDASPWLAVETWLEIGGSECAAEIVAEVLSADMSAESRMFIADSFVENGLLAPAVTLWLDIAAHHGQAVDQGVTAVSRLVKCGYRDQAIAVLQEAIGNDRSPDVARAPLRALLAWAVIISPTATPAELAEKLGPGTTP